MQIQPQLKRNINQTAPGSLLVPIYAHDGQVARKKDADGIWRVPMIEPNILASLNIPLKASLGKEGSKIFNKHKELGHAQLSNTPYDMRQANRITAANAVQPYESDWRMIDETIRRVSRRTDNLELNFFSSLGLVDTSLSWNDFEIENIVAQPLKPRSNGRYAFTSLVPSTILEPFEQRFGNGKTSLPITHNSYITGSRPAGPVTDNMNASDAGVSTILQMNYDSLYGSGNIDLSNPITYWAGLLNSPQQETFDNTLNGGPARFFNNPTDIEDVLTFVDERFELHKHYEGFAMLVGTDIKRAIARTIGDNKTDKMTLSMLMENFAQTLNQGPDREPNPLRWAVSHKIPKNSIAFFVTDPLAIQYKTAGGLNVFELFSNGLATNSFIWGMQALITPGNGIDTAKSIIYITDLL
jgi:hypothetical protein